ncbi:Arm DNA-binding domain-containing protein [Kitasatospora griseola]|uniref:Arm DNA-binding domain-containing protein n=1 Tax=Kitasatospora griseola TaxID=2064 RepID=UPI0038291AB3
MGQRTRRERVYRRCGCTDEHRKQLGPWCVRLLKEASHGSWTYCVDLAPADGKRRTRRRGGFTSRAEAAREMAAVLDGELRGVYENRRTTVASYLRE